MASLVSSSLKTGRLIFILPPDSLWGCQPWYECLEPPDLLDLDDTDEKVDPVLWSLSNPWPGEGEGERGGAAHNCHSPGLNLGLNVAPSLILGSLARGHVWAPPILQQLLGGLQVVGTSLDYES